MTTPLLATKLFAPRHQPGVIPRVHLIERLDQGQGGELTLISAPAGFGKTTLVSEWLATCPRPAAWLALDSEDGDLAVFLAYLVAALQTVHPQVGEHLTGMLQSPQLPPPQTLLTGLLNELAALPDEFILVLDDYHVLDSQAVDAALTFLVDHLPPRLHLVITTREDPQLPLARLRARRMLAEFRASDLRFSAEETALLLNQMMGLSLSGAELLALETRTEGWIAGLQLAGLSMQGRQDTGEFIRSFTGSHHFVLDYLVEEVLSQQPPHIQDFLLRTSILERMCGALCDAVLLDEGSAAGETLERIRQANLFLVPLDSEREWYRYHHLFGELLRKRLQQAVHVDAAALHRRASAWYEAHGFEVEAFQHAAAAGDTQRAEQLINAGVPLYFRGITRPVLNWLESLASHMLDARPSLWVTYAWTLMAAHRSTQIESRLRAAEVALADVEPDASTKDLLGHIAAIRAMEAAIQYDTDTIIAQARRALDFLHPDNLYIRTAVTRALAIAYQFRGERAAARNAYQKAIAMSEASNNYFVMILAITGLGIIQEADTQLYQAADSYQRVLDLVGDPNQPIACAAYLGLARLHYEWNDLDAAQAYGEHGVRLARQIESIDSAPGGEILLARVKLAQGDVAAAAARLDAVEQLIRQHQFSRQIPVVAEARVSLCLRRGEVQQAANLAQINDLPLSQVRVALAQNRPADALNLLLSYRQQVEARAWQDEQLKTRVLQAVAHHQHNDREAALAVIGEVLALAAPGGFVRTFLDAGPPVRELLADALAQGVIPDYSAQLLAAFAPVPAQPLIEPLSERELEILRLVADGFSNRDISEQLFLALSTVKGHNHNIYAKLQVQRRTEAVARARELGLL